MATSKIYWSYQDGQDGSHSIILHPFKEQALERLNKTEEQLQDGNIYDDGAFGEIEAEIDEGGNLVNEVSIYIE